MSFYNHVFLILLHAVLISIFCFRRAPAVLLVFLWTLFCVEIAVFSMSYAGYSQLALVDEYALRGPLSQAYAGISIWEERKVAPAASRLGRDDLVKFRLVLHQADGSERCLTMVSPGHEFHYTSANGAELSSSSPLDSAGLAMFLQDHGIDLERPGVKNEMALLLQVMLDIETDGLIEPDNWSECVKHFGEVEYRRIGSRNEWLWRRVLIAVVLAIILWCLGMLGGYRHRKKATASSVGTSERTRSDTSDTQDIISNSS